MSKIQEICGEKCDSCLELSKKFDTESFERFALRATPQCEDRLGHEGGCRVRCPYLCGRGCGVGQKVTGTVYQAPLPPLKQQAEAVAAPPAQVRPPPTLEELAARDDDAAVQLAYSQLHPAATVNEEDFVSFKDAKLHAEDKLSWQRCTTEHSEHAGGAHRRRSTAWRWDRSREYAPG